MTKPKLTNPCIHCTLTDAILDAIVLWTREWHQGVRNCGEARMILRYLGFDMVESP